MNTFICGSLALLNFLPTWLFTATFSETHSSWKRLNCSCLVAVLLSVVAWVFTSQLSHCHNVTTHACFINTVKESVIENINCNHQVVYLRSKNDFQSWSVCVSVSSNLTDNLQRKRRFIGLFNSWTGSAARTSADCKPSECETFIKEWVY